MKRRKGNESFTGSAAQGIREKASGASYLEWLAGCVAHTHRTCTCRWLLAWLLREGRVWIKGLHIVVGVASIIPVIYYLLLAGKHWKQLKERPWQRFNVIVVLSLLLGWFVSGVLLWQFRVVGPHVSNVALIVHDLLTWIGLPYIIYHSLTRVKWLKEPSRRIVKSGIETGSPSNHRETPQPVYTRRAFIRGSIGVGLAVTIGPSFIKWLGSSIGNIGGSETIDKLIESDRNQLLPAPQPLAASSPLSEEGRKDNSVFTQSLRFQSLRTTIGLLR